MAKKKSLGGIFSPSVLLNVQKKEKLKKYIEFEAEGRRINIFLDVFKGNDPDRTP